MSAAPSQANIAAQCSRTASSSATRAIPAPSAVNICTENAAARMASDADDESCWFIWSIWVAVLSGIGAICTSAIAAFRRANLVKNHGGCRLENAAGDVDCPGYGQY